MNIQNKKKWILVDGHNLAFRCFYGVPLMTRSDGMQINAIYGFIRTLLKLENIYKPNAICVFFDTGGSQIRKEVLSTYKANRKKMPTELNDQIQHIATLVLLMGYYVKQHAGIEADDLIGTYAKQIAMQDEIALIASADKDFSQCISENIFQLLPPKNKSKSPHWQILDAAGIVDKYGLTVNQMVDYLSLTGDSVDNIEGVPGVGPKTAVKWLSALQSIDKIYDNIEQIFPERFRSILLTHKEIVYRNKRLIALQEYHDIEVPAAEHKPDYVALGQQLQELELYSIAHEIREKKQQMLF